MSFADLYTTGEHRRNLAHFAALATLASIDGEVSAEEKEMLDRFATKLDITKSEYEEVLKKENKYPIETTNDEGKRLERLFDLFKIVYTDHGIDQEEIMTLRRYAIGMGFTSEKAEQIIQRSIAIFGGKIDFEDYLYLLKL